MMFDLGHNWHFPSLNTVKNKLFKNYDVYLVIYDVGQWEYGNGTRRTHVQQAWKRPRTATTSAAGEQPAIPRIQPPEAYTVSPCKTPICTNTSFIQ